MADTPGVAESCRFGTASGGLRMQPAPSDRAVPHIFWHGSKNDRQDQPLPSGCRSGPSPGAARSFTVCGGKTVSRLSGSRHCSRRHPNGDTMDGSGARLRLLRPAPFHQRVQVFFRTESPRIPAADSPRIDSLQWRSNFSNTPSPFACDNDLSSHLRTAKEETNGNPYSGRDRG
jgi:hypothetical protein